jgi:hypothetical protein
VRKDGRSYRPVQYSFLICSRCGKPLHCKGAACTSQAHVGTYTLNGWGLPPWLRHGLSDNTHVEEDALAQLILDLAGARPP